MSRKPMGEKAMTAAERQRRRRAKLRAENPPQKPGRPRHAWLEPSTLELFQKAMGKDARSARRWHANRSFEGFGKQILRIDPRFPDYSPEDAKHFEPLSHKKGILEQLGRHVVFMLNVIGYDPDDAAADAREYAELMLKDGNLDAAAAVRFFRWLREDVGEAEAIASG
jgi:hypothetical protein